MVFEVLSPSTSRIDRIEKLREYQATPSIKRYVILEPDTIAATIYLKQAAAWTVSLMTGDSMLTMPEVAADIPLSEIISMLNSPRKT